MRVTDCVSWLADGDSGMDADRVGVREFRRLGGCEFGRRSKVTAFKRAADGMEDGMDLLRGIEEDVILDFDRAIVEDMECLRWLESASKFNMLD